MNAHERPIISADNKTAVRAGVTGNNVRYVLIGSVALAIVAWILWSISSGHEPRSQSRNILKCRNHFDSREAA